MCLRKGAALAEAGYQYNFDWTFALAQEADWRGQTTIDTLVALQTANADAALWTAEESAIGGLLLCTLTGCTKMARETFPLREGVRRTAKPATDAEIKQAEEALSVEFPDDYRVFLKKVNGTLGGVAVPIRDSFTGLDEPHGVNGLYGVSSDVDKRYRLLDGQDAHHFRERVPKRFIIIGWTGGMDQVCISTSGPDRGSVYMWYPVEVDSWDKVEKNSEEHLTLIAKNFREFWSKLRPWSDDD